MVAFFNTILYEPLYNGLIFFISILPGGDVGLAVVLFTIVVKLALFSLSYKSIKAQVKMKTLEPEITAIKEKYKDNRQQQALETMALYKKANVNPFSTIMVILMQIPVILALYFVFVRGGLPEIDPDLLYSFTRIPETINMTFLGLVDISKKSLILAVLAGGSQFFQARLLIPAKQKKKRDAPSLKEDFAHSMHMQMRYVLPVVVGFFAYTFGAAVALYWTTSNLFAIGQELYLRKRINKENGQDARIRDVSAIPVEHGA